MSQPSQQLHQIEKSVTHLLVATKLLLETLTQWSRATATEGEVSDVYVRLGYEFNIACRAFNAIGVDTGDLGPVPDLLRGILEETLSQEASQASLDRFLPRIRDIIINLLQGLKKKQAKLRARAARDTDRGPGPSAPTRQDSIDVLGDTPLSESQIPSRTTSGLSRQSVQRTSSRDLHAGPELPPRTSSRNEGRISPNYGAERYDSQTTMQSSNSQSSNSTMSSTTAQNIPIIVPYPAEDTIPTGPQPPPHTSAAHNFPHPPPPPPKQDALLALQRGGDLERRASRRFSTYQIKQQLGGAANGIPMIPTQNSPIPNRGREVRESIQAVRQRGSTQYNRTKTERRLIGETSPPRKPPNRIPEESPKYSNQAPEAVEPGSPNLRTPEDKLGPSFFDRDGTERPRMSAVVAGPIDEPMFMGDSGLAAPSMMPQRKISRKAQTATPPPQVETQFNNEDSPQPGKPLTLFLQYKSKVKKIILDDGSNDLSVGRIQLAFIDKFAWNTHSEGIELPEIYIQDNLSGVRYELEDLSDIKNNTVLVLNVEPLDEVKRHIDDGLSSLRRVVESIKTSVDDQQGAIQRVSERQQETAKEIAGISLAPRSIASIPSTPGQKALPTTKSSLSSLDQLSEIQTLRRDLAIMRQTYSSFTADVEASMAAVRTKAASVKSVALKVALPSISGESGRAYVKKGLYETLLRDQTAAFERVDEIQDSIEDLRKDVVMRGVRPLPRQLEQVAKDLANAAAEVKRLEAFLAKEKPMWTKVWKQELQQVCDDKDAVGESEMLVADLTADLEEAEGTFRLVEEACKQQNLEPADGKSPRNISGGRMVALNSIDQSVDPRKAKDGVLGEVKGLQVDHESRLEAIARAERNRQKELESRKEGEFKKELGSFVDEGKLKKTGGVEEAERLRKARDERTRREVWERQNGITPAPSAPPAINVNGEDEAKVEDSGPVFVDAPETMPQA
jgi:hypothetical protein